MMGWIGAYRGWIHRAYRGRATGPIGGLFVKGPTGAERLKAPVLAPVLVRHRPTGAETGVYTFRYTQPLRWRSQLVGVFGGV